MDSKKQGDTLLKSLEKHSQWRGKLEITPRCEISTKEELALAYTPGVAQPCREIYENPEKAYEYTRKWNTVAVVTDGSAVLGLGDIGATAGLPVMEGKAALFKAFANIDAIPICLGTKEIDEIVDTVVNISPTFGGINLEDISAPRCFEIEERLKKKLDIPVFHDDQHGTAIVVLAALLNALKLTGDILSDVKIVINGAGAAGTAIASLLIKAGASNVIMADRAGAIFREPQGSESSFSPEHVRLAQTTNPNNEKGELKDIICGANVFIGVSAPGVLSGKMVESMAENPIIFAMANPTPEIMPDIAKAYGAYVVGTGRSDFPNQINNVLAFPGIFRGALDGRIKEITDEMKIAAAYAIADLVKDSELSPDYIIPDALDKRVAPAVASAVKSAQTG